MSRAFIPSIVAQIGDAIPALWTLRSIATRSGNYRLTDLAQLDDRIEATLDALRTTGSDGRRRCERTLALDTAGELFAATVFALESRDETRIQLLRATAEALPETRVGFHDAFGWVSAELLRGIVKTLLDSPCSFNRSTGIGASAAHGVHPGKSLLEGMRAPEADVRSAAMRAAGELGAVDVLGMLDGGQDETCSFWAARSAVLLGGGDRSARVLARLVQRPGPFRERGLSLALSALPLTEAHELLKDLAQDPASFRTLVRGAGIAGDPSLVGWLIKQMHVPFARIAGEAFTLITGADLAANRLEGKRPEDFQVGPNENPKDPNVEMDPDEGLAWPDPERIQGWWTANVRRFEPGVRYFMGAPVTRAHCANVLKNSYQRQRILAAQYLCLLQPGTPLFNTSAPAWRQQRWLSRMA